MSRLTERVRHEMRQEGFKPTKPTKPTLGTSPPPGFGGGTGERARIPADTASSSVENGVLIPGSRFLTATPAGTHQAENGMIPGQRRHRRALAGPVFERVLGNPAPASLTHAGQRSTPEHPPDGRDRDTEGTPGLIDAHEGRL